MNANTHVYAHTYIHQDIPIVYFLVYRDSLKKSTSIGAQFVFTGIPIYCLLKLNLLNLALVFLNHL